MLAQNIPEEPSWTVATPGIFFRVVIIDQNTHTHKHVHKVLQFSSTNFFILKSLHDSLIINVTSYISFKILVR